MFLGCDTEAVRELAATLQRRALAVEKSAGEVLNGASDPEIWTGSDGDAFRSEIAGVQHALAFVVRGLVSRADELRAQAESQDLASAEDGLFSAELTAASAFDAELPQPGGDDGGQRRDSRTSGVEPKTVPINDAEAEKKWNREHPGGPTWKEWLSRYRQGPPQRPEIEWDNDFPFESKKGQWTPADLISRTKWDGMLLVAQASRPDLDDATPLYAHYRDTSGTPMMIDYDEGYREDPGIQRSIDSAIVESQSAAQQMIREGGRDFSFTGPNSATRIENYPETENWQKTLGGYQQWSSGDVVVDESGHARMVVTVHAEDKYNFNKSASDIATGEPDSENGRFSELGWAREFDVSGQSVRVVEWDVKNPSSMTVRESE